VRGRNGSGLSPQYEQPPPIGLWTRCSHCVAECSIRCTSSICAIMMSDIDDADDKSVESVRKSDGIVMTAIHMNMFIIIIILIIKN
jgi:hypothetical protein